MDTQHSPPTAGPTGLIDMTFVLLLLQAGFGLLSTIGLFIFAAAAPALAVMGLISLGVSVLIVLLAAGVVLLQRWAQVAATVFEGLVLLSAAFRLLVRGGSPTGLVWLLATVVLPMTVVILLWHQDVRAAIATRRGSRSARPIQARPVGLSQQAPEVQ